MSHGNNSQNLFDTFLNPQGPACFVIKARLRPVGDLDRFQPAGFPEIGHVLYDAPRGDNMTEKICILDSPASMANHLETICLAGPNEIDLHDDLAGLPYVVCTTDRQYKIEDGQIVIDPQQPHDKIVCSTFTEGHRLASDYFLDSYFGQPTWKQQEVKIERGRQKTIPAHWEGKNFRAQLREEFNIVEVKKDKTYFIYPDNWWTIYQTIFKYDPNSLIHGVMFAKEQIKLSRLLTAHHEAFGAARVGSSGVKFDRLGKTLSGQPIFAVDEETAHEIRATFIFDLALLRSYGRNGKGLQYQQKKLLLGLALWKIKQLLRMPFRFRTQCYLQCEDIELNYDVDNATQTENPQHAKPKDDPDNKKSLPCFPEIFETLDIKQLIRDCSFDHSPITSVYYPTNELFKSGKEKEDEQETDNSADNETPEDTNDDMGD